MVDNIEDFTPRNIKQVELSDSYGSNVKFVSNTVDPEAFGKGVENVAPEKDFLAIALSKKVSQTDRIPAPDTVLSLEHTTIPYRLFHRGSASTISGKAKVGKTTVIALLTANALRNGLRVLWIDTEQGAYYASTTQYYILKIIGLSVCPNLEMFDFREESPLEKIELTEALLGNQSYDLIIIDGVRDYVFDINSPEEATLTMCRIMKWTVEFNCHICMLIHENKQGGELRGHLGTECENKSEVIISLTQSKDSNPITSVSCKAVRGRAKFEDFYMTRDEDGIPFIDTSISVNADPNMPSIPKAKKRNDPWDIPMMFHLQILNEIFKDPTPITSTKLRSELRKNWVSEKMNYEGLYQDIFDKDSIGDTYAKDLKEYYSDSKLILEVDAPGNSKAISLNPEYVTKEELVKNLESVNQLEITDQLFD